MGQDFLPAYVVAQNALRHEHVLLRNVLLHDHIAQKVRLPDGTADGQTAMMPESAEWDDSASAAVAAEPSYFRKLVDVPVAVAPSIPNSDEAGRAMRRWT